MSVIDPRADTALVNWSDLGVSALLPTGTATLLLADVEGSRRPPVPVSRNLTMVAYLLCAMMCRA
ncbi:MAG TPA: hypothetical protein VEI45_09220 [Mycobacterium sp.]|uniref:hypothetical protein n=1 Tax=Mycobacterium sp. TaxID=1785 RepID=UPI002D4A11B4|nr:hypothetical protein [Mycobacterium sp.]HXY64509.1 hypothetical protein [Mycobacterium sp.]